MLVNFCTLVHFWNSVINFVVIIYFEKCHLGELALPSPLPMLGFQRKNTSRPGNIRIFMYLGLVCKFQAGTRVPASPRLAQKSIFAGKTRWKQNLSKLSHIWKRDVPNHESTHTGIQLFWNLFIIILFINHNLMLKSWKASWNVSKHATLYFLHWDSGNLLSEFISGSRYHWAGTRVFLPGLNTSKHLTDSKL